MQLLMINIYQDLLGKSGLKFMINQKEGNYNVKKDIRFKTSMLRSDSCDFNDAYIAVKQDINVGAPNNAKKKKKKH